MSYDNFQWSQLNPNYSRPLYSNELKQTGRNGLETFSCPKLFPVGGNSPLSPRPESLLIGSSRPGIQMKNIEHARKVGKCWLILLCIFFRQSFAIRIFLQQIVDKFHCCFKQNRAIMVKNCPSSWILYRKIFIFQV